MKTADEQTSETEKQQTNVGGSGQNKTSDDRQKDVSSGSPKYGSRKCGLCGGSYPHPVSFPAQDKQCLNCGKMNHFLKFEVVRAKTAQNPPTQGNLQRVNTVQGLWTPTVVLQIQLLLTATTVKSILLSFVHRNPNRESRLPSQ